MDEDDAKYAMTHEEALASTRQAEVVVWVMAAVLLGIGCAIAYWIWPPGIMDVPLASVTVGTFLRMLASGVIALIFLGVAVLLVAF